MSTRHKPIAAGLAAVSIFAGSALAGETPSRPDAKAYFVNLQDGDAVSSPVLIQFGLRGMGVAPAGVEMEGTGHHHLIVNEEIEGDELDFAIPADDQHKHFGGGQTEATLELPPGDHVLQLVLGDHLHVPHNPPVMSKRIKITVK